MDDKDLTHEQLSQELTNLRLQVARLEKQAAKHESANFTDSEKAIETKLKEKEQYMRLFMESTSDCFWNWNMISNDIERSTGFSRIFGYGSQEIQSGINWWIDRLHPDDKERILTTFETASAEGDSTCGYEYRF